GLGVTGVPTRALSWAQLAQAAEQRREPLGIEHLYTQQAATFPFGTHVSVVEVDTQTGAITILRHIAVDDCGRQINPLIVDAHSHLGIRHIDMPCTPERVWRAISEAGTGSIPPVWREPPTALRDIPPPDRPPRQDS